MEYLRQVFAFVCGQSHCWAPGGDALPFCQRCTGLYVGAAVAVVLQAILRPRPTNLSLWVHGLLLLLMVPFGYHWVAQNGLVRTLTGQLFGVGLASYLSLLPASHLRWWQGEGKRARWGYPLCVLLSVMLLQLAVHVGGRFAGAVLAWSGLLGLVALLALSLANLFLLSWAACRNVRRTFCSLAS